MSKRAAGAVCDEVGSRAAQCGFTSVGRGELEYKLNGGGRALHGVTRPLKEQRLWSSRQSL